MSIFPPRNALRDPRLSFRHLSRLARDLALARRQIEIASGVLRE